MMKKIHSPCLACWVDNAILPQSCVIDDDERYNCVYAEHINSPYECCHWNKVLAIQLAQEIVGNEFKIVRRGDGGTGETGVLGRLSDEGLSLLLDM